MWTTSVPGVLISREAMNLARAVSSELYLLLTETACEQVKPQGEWIEKRVVGPADIETTARSLTIDLLALIESARVELHAREEARRVA